VSKTGFNQATAQQATPAQGLAGHEAVLGNHAAEAEKCLRATTWPSAVYEYFRAAFFFVLPLARRHAHDHVAPELGDGPGRSCKSPRAGRWKSPPAFTRSLTSAPTRPGNDLVCARLTGTGPFATCTA